MTVAVDVAVGSGVEVGVGDGKGMLDAATALETGVAVAMLDMAMAPEVRLGIGEAVGVAVGDGNVLRAGVPAVCWGLSWLDAQANEPEIKTSRMEISVYFLKGFALQQW